MDRVLFRDGHMKTISSEEALEHVRYQKEVMKSPKNWHVQYFKITFGEQAL